LHPVVAVYATFLNRAFDQVLLDVALHRLPVTFVLDRAGITGEDGPSHNGVWDLAILGVVPGIHIAAPRDESRLRAQLRDAVAYSDGPTVVRFPKTPLPADIPALRSLGHVDVLAEDGAHDTDVLIVAVGASAPDALAAADMVRGAGFTVRVVDPGWVTPVAEELLDLARDSRLVVTLEDGSATGGVGTRVAQAAATAGVPAPVRQLGVPTRFPAHGSVADVKSWAGLTSQDVGRRIVEWAVLVCLPSGPDDNVPVSRGSVRSGRPSGDSEKGGR
jgi:1-deoxy-D-xylulose-5-phosphate synthase